ncbi:hypothetical protein BD324DRAFT_631915 [Kockovaella imperatae]|uniref:Macro domain-containing protein n=1 Tax=Kockovaella imperatae TaxID=4999 RepID=A0A1Y1UB16_9TREE|nr:hypothetical protein BD324DRAFT_631915 [Kockovaella imperatae]ORX35230.1 hypothetical protein BD324DRAFT_631915 [Kockovaella imperatae]
MLRLHHRLVPLLSSSLSSTSSYSLQRPILSCTPLDQGHPLSTRNMSSRSSAENTSAKDIPTLHDLYAKDELQNSEEEDPVNSADEKLNSRISIWRGNIVHLQADMVVNAANKSLLGGGGVDGAIHRAAGPELLKECEGLGRAETGETKVTQGYRLPAKRVAHTVGPVYAKTKVDEKAAQLESCYRTSLELCAEHGGGVIGFSSISTGIYGYPIVDATRIALQTTRKFLETNENVTRVIYVTFSERDKGVYESLAPIYFPKP